MKLRKAAFVCAHTDDEMVCAGTLRKLVRHGVEVWVIACAPAASIDDRAGTDLSIQAVEPEWHRALDHLGILNNHRCFLKLVPSADLQRHRQTICQYVYDFCEREKPDLVITLSPEDENTAHAVVGVECERVLRGRVPVAIRCQFPWNYSIGRSNLYVALAEQDLEAKRQVIAAYRSQHWRYNYAELLIHQAMADGLSVKVPAAEKFEVIRAVL